MRWERWKRQIQRLMVSIDIVKCYEYYIDRLYLVCTILFDNGKPTNNFYYCLQPMSKKRSLRHRSNPFFNTSIDEHKLKNSSFFGESTIRSKYIPDNVRTISNLKTNLNDFHKEKIFNRNISFFRQSFNQNDPSQLPFMSSLRSPNKYKSLQLNKTTICEPFENAQRQTSNVKIKKNISDFKEKGMRMSAAYYRWHNTTGVGIKQATNYECTLRDYNKSWAHNQKEKNFDNRIRPINYEDVQTPTYEKSQLICSRQRRLFKVK